MENSNKHWHPLYTKPRQEFKAEQQIALLGIEYYLPTVTRLKQWSDRKKKVTEPLFNGYIFVYGEEKDRLYALQQNAIVRSLTFNGKPAYVQNWEIENLKKMLAEKREVTIKNTLIAGTKVRVVDGPFKDVEGIVSYTPNNERELAVVIDLLKRSVVVYLPPECVVKKID
ncbi:MAG: UpxY family transcription antiterminator [Bacteroidetes bacterium]|nr:UpxY family transcription antiterminator [Bacteroidota bacterium]